MVDVLVIPDGGAQPVHPERSTAIEAAWTPALDRIATQGAVVRVATTPARLRSGSEIGIPALLGLPPTAPIGRGRVDAAGHGIDVPDGLIPWRADLAYRNGRRASIRQARDVCSHLGAQAHAIGGHRLLLLAPSRPADRRILGLRLSVWDDGPGPSGRLARPTTVICAPGAAAGCARLLGADVIVPAGATGDVDSDLAGKAHAAIAAIAEGAHFVVVHVGAPDEAAHRRDQAQVVAAIERIDAEIVGPLREVVERVGGRLAVCPDHVTDPDTGQHDPAPVPALVWPAQYSPAGACTYDERSARGAPLIEVVELLRSEALA